MIIPGISDDGSASSFSITPDITALMEMPQQTASLSASSAIVAGQSLSLIKQGLMTQASGNAYKVEVDTLTSAMKALKAERDRLYERLAT